MKINEFERNNTKIYSIEDKLPSSMLNFEELENIFIILVNQLSNNWSIKVKSQERTIIVGNISEIPANNKIKEIVFQSSNSLGENIFMSLGNDSSILIETQNELKAKTTINYIQTQLKENSPWYSLLTPKFCIISGVLPMLSVLAFLLYLLIQEIMYPNKLFFTNNELLYGVIYGIGAVILFIIMSICVNCSLDKKITFKFNNKQSSFFRDLNINILSNIIVGVIFFILGLATGIKF